MPSENQVLLLGAALQDRAAGFDPSALVTPAIAVALIAGLFALIGHLIGRSNTKLQAEISEKNAKLQTRLAANLKLAEMRQAWINSLRDDMAAFQSIGVTPDASQTKMQEFYRLGTRIELFMNPDDENYPDLQQALYAFLQAQTTKEKYAANPGYVEVCQKILKSEWDVLKAEITTVADGSDAVDVHKPERVGEVESSRHGLNP